MNYLNLSLLAMVFSISALKAELCMESGCGDTAQEKVQYCEKHGCPLGRSPEKLCSLPKGHKDACKMVKRQKS